MKRLKIQRLSRAKIRPYGYIIDKSFLKDDKEGDKFGVLIEEKSKGWRIGYLVLRKHAMVRLEQHPDSLETFEPVKGRVIIALSPNKRPEAMELFLLDKPVVIKKGVWHDCIAVSPECEIKIFENIEVKTAYHYLKNMVVV